MKIKKVLFLTPRGSDKYLGGVEKHVKILSEKLREKGIEVGELSLTDIASLDSSQTLRMTDGWFYLWDHRKLILDSDIIHVHDVFWWYSPFRFLFFWKSVFITFHGWEGVYPPSRSAILQKKLADVLCRGTIGVGKYLEKWYGIKVDEITYGAIGDIFIASLDPSSRTPQDDGKTMACQNDTMSVIFLGRLEEVNGVEIALEAANLSRSDLPSIPGNFKGQTSTAKGRTFQSIFVGDGSYRKKCQKYGKVTGMIKNVNKYLEKADVVIASSYLSIMEAMAMDKPIIAIANNPLKWDYLNCYPMAERMKIVKTTEQLANLLRTVLPGVPGKFKRQSSQNSQAKWAREQTPEKLANLYLKLWKK